MEAIKFYLARLLYFFKVIDLPSAIVQMLPENDKALIQRKIQDLDNDTSSDEFAIQGHNKRKVVVRYFIDQLLKDLDYFWLNAIFDNLPKGYKEYLANAIVEIIFFNLKKLD